ncbi:MAG: flippase [Nitrococcus mobilis]|nr:flippase [Nitrococcus mobilis]
MRQRSVFLLRKQLTHWSLECQGTKAGNTKVPFKITFRMPHSGGLQAQLLRGGIVSIIIKIAAMALSLMIAVVLARMLGPEGYGIYAYVFAWVFFLLIPAQFGIPELVVRESAKAHAHNDWCLYLGLLIWSRLALSIFAVVFSGLAMFLIWLFGSHFSGLHLKTFFWGLVLVPLIALTRLNGATLQGLRKVVQGQLSENIIRPGIFMLFLFCVIFFHSENSLNPNQAMALYTLGAIVTFFVSAWFVYRERPKEIDAAVVPYYKYRCWISSAFPLSFIAGMGIVNAQTDLLMLGFFTSANEVGVYRVAVQGANLVSFGLAALAMVITPYFARFHVNGDFYRFQRLATVSARAMLVLAIPIALVFIFFGKQILALVFGVEYVQAYSPLAILSIAHVIHAGFGIVGPLLNMSGYEKITAKGITVAALCNIILNFIFIPFYGMVGAALATAGALIIWNIVLWEAVRRTLGIDSSALNLMASKQVVHH